MGKEQVNISINELIKDNPYVGRGIIVGKSEDGKHAVTAYFIMGRSANSRNRILALHDGELFTEPFDASKVEDPSLIIYRAIRMYENRLIVTNGDHTDTIYEGLSGGKTMSEAMKSREFEPDVPNYTPRISAVADLGGKAYTYEISILKSADDRGSACNRFTFSYSSLSGVGHFIHTYGGDGNPLPSFSGEPEEINIPDDIDELTEEIWRGLNEDNRIALYVRYTDLETLEYEERLVNKYSR